MPVPLHCDTERQVEVPWMLNHVVAPIHILDVGGSDSFYHQELCNTGAHVTVIDTRPVTTGIGVHEIRADATRMPTNWQGQFDCTLCISVLDHVGLDSYGNTADEHALGLLCDELARVTAVGGALLVTAPVGQDLLTTHPGGGQRVFSLSALMALFPGFLWHMTSLSLWRCKDGTYQRVATPADIESAGYLGHRAEAVACMSFRRRPLLLHELRSEL